MALSRGLVERISVLTRRMSVFGLIEPNSEFLNLKRVSMSLESQTYELEINDVQYLINDNFPLLARVFRPKGTGPFPVVIELHGGAWVRGDRQNGDSANEALAREGMIVAVSYTHLTLPTILLV